jgi:hypothetical protein
MKALRIVGLVLVGFALGTLGFDLVVWAWFRMEWAVTGDFTRWAWYYYSFPYYHVMGIGTFVAALGATLALLGDRHERSTD